MPVAQTANAPNFESVWAILQEVTASQRENAIHLEKLRESQKESAVHLEKLRERQEETNLQMKETDRVLKEQSKEINIKIGSLTNLFGDMTVGMAAPKLREKLMEYGFAFLRSSVNVTFEDKKEDIAFEVDVLLENGERAMLIEVKTKVTEERVNKHITRLEKMRRYADLHNDKRIFLGAIAGFSMTDNERKYVLNQGFYLIEPDGENFFITPPNIKPKEW